MGQVKQYGPGRVDMGRVKQVHGRFLFPKGWEMGCMREYKLEAVGMRVEQEESRILRFHAWPRLGEKD
jgi:hypothetical protein